MEKLKPGFSPDRLAPYGLGVVFVWIGLAASYVRGTGDDWRIFWAAGHNLGSTAILTASHFVYMPGSAWVLWPFAHMPPAAGYFVYVAAMVGLTVAGSGVASRLYGLSISVTALMALAWFPFTIAICLGQNVPVAFFLVVLAIAAFVGQNQTMLGVAVGLLLYKPSDAAPMILLLLIYKHWRSLGIVGAFAVGWYLLSAAATGDWLWPVPYMQTLTALYRSDVAMNSDFAISVPTFLVRLGVPNAVAWGMGAAILLGSAPLLRRVSRLEAGSIMPLVGIAASPHAWGYEAMLAVPALWLTATRLNPVRLSLVWIAYAIAPVYLFSRQLHFDALAIPVLGGVAYWFVTKLRSRS